jgi:hypothetical protein
VRQLADLWNALSTAWTSIVGGEACSGETEHAFLRRLDRWETDRANGWRARGRGDDQFGGEGLLIHTG